MIDSPGQQDISSLRSDIVKPSIGGKELLPLTSIQLDGFIHPGPLPEQYSYTNTISIKKHENKYSRNKHKEGGLPSQETSANNKEISKSEKNPLTRRFWFKKAILVQKCSF